MAEINVSVKKAMYKTIEHHVGVTHAEFIIDKTTKIIAIYAKKEEVFETKTMTNRRLKHLLDRLCKCKKIIRRCTISWDLWDEGT